MDDTDEEARIERAKARRERGWHGEKVLAGTPKAELYLDLSPIERFEAMARLCLAQWLANNPLPARLERSQWPGEKFEIETSHDER